MKPRDDSSSFVLPVRTVSPASRACASVIPTPATSGSVKVVCGSAWYAAGGPSSPRMSRRAIAFWYIATCVNAPLPVTSPIAHSLSTPVTRIRSSTSRVRTPGSTPTVCSPRSWKFGFRPAASQQLVGHQLLAVAEGEGERAVGVRDLRRVDARQDPDAFVGEHVGQQRGRFRLVGREQPVAVLDHGDPDPEPGEDLRQLTADRAAAEHHQGRRQRR